MIPALEIARVITNISISNIHIQNMLANIVGYAAAICMIFGYMPQAIYTIRTRDTDGIAMTTFLLLGFGSLFFVIQGILISNIPLVLTNAITTVSSAIVFVIKVQNDRRKKGGPGKGS